jgi:hypothetical protein
VPLRVHHPCLQPLTAPVAQGPGVDTPAHQGHAPRRGQRRAAALALSLSQSALPAVLEGQGAGPDRRQRPPAGAIAGTTLQPILRSDGGPQLRTGQGPQFGCQGGHSSGPGRGLAAGHRVGPVGPGSALGSTVAPRRRWCPARGRPRRLPSRGPPHWPPPSSGPASRRAAARPPSIGTAPATGVAGPRWLWWLGPAGRLAAGAPLPQCPAAVACAGSVLPSWPAPCRGRPHR